VRLTNEWITSNAGWIFLAAVVVFIAGIFFTQDSDQVKIAKAYIANTPEIIDVTGEIKSYGFWRDAKANLANDTLFVSMTVHGEKGKFLVTVTLRSSFGRWQPIKHNLRNDE
jgi:hypothetical protein